MKENLTYYELSRYWFDFCNNNFDIIKPIHTALYFYLLDLNNRLNNPQFLKLPKEFAMQAIGVSNWRTYSNALNDITNWGFLELVSKAKNQSSATVVAIVKNTIAIKVCHCKKYNSKYSSIVGVINNIPTNVGISLKTNKLNTHSDTRERGYSEGAVSKEENSGFENYKEKLLNEQIWISLLESKFKLSISEIHNKLKEFNTEMILRGEEASIENMEDAKRRFFFWLNTSRTSSKTESKHTSDDWKQNLMNSTLNECNKL